MFGEIVLSEPRALVWHSRYGRGYSYNMDDLIHNQMLAAYTIGGEKWAERILITYLNKEGTDHKVVWGLYNQALEEGKEDREYILKNQKITFQDILDKKPWDMWNMEHHKRAQSNMVIFDEWVTRLKDKEAKEVYKNSKFQ